LFEFHFPLDAHAVPQALPARFALKKKEKKRKKKRLHFFEQEAVCMFSKLQSNRLKHRRCWEVDADLKRRDGECVRLCGGGRCCVAKADAVDGWV
jgi:hypothetical protein